MTPEERKDILERVCARIEAGELTSKAAEAEGITDRTIRNWVSEDEAARFRYTRARELAADALAEQAVGIATTGVGPDGVTYTDAQERRLAYDALRWLAGKRRPKEYGDKQSIEVSGGIEHLHLDALRSISAKARIANDLASSTPPIALPAETPYTGPIRGTGEEGDSQ